MACDYRYLGMQTLFMSARWHVQWRRLEAVVQGLGSKAWGLGPGAEATFGGFRIGAACKEFYSIWGIKGVSLNPKP